MEETTNVYADALLRGLAAGAEARARREAFGVELEKASEAVKAMSEGWVELRICTPPVSQGEGLYACVTKDRDIKGDGLCAGPERLCDTVDGVPFGSSKPQGSLVEALSLQNTVEAILSVKRSAERCAAEEAAREAAE